MDLGISLVPQYVPTVTKKKKDISIVIAHRGPAMGLWATIHSCIADLSDSDLDYEFIVVVNGEDKLSYELEKQQHFLGKDADRLRVMVHVKEPLSPPTARQMATEHAQGDYLFFFDNHCLVSKNYFVRAIASMNKYNMDLLHSTTCFWHGEGYHYEYQLSLKRDFWTRRPFMDAQSEEPYRIAMAGHGGFVVRRKVWEEVGGYWQGFVGYGGEESYFDLKMALLGKENWIDPALVHYHFAGERGYTRHFTDDYFRNMMMAANIIGGEEWLHTVYNSFKRFTRLTNKDGSPLTPLFDLLKDAQRRSQSHADWLAERRVTTLDDVLKSFTDNNIRY